MHALLDITRTCASCAHHAGIGHGPGTRRSGQLKDAAMCHGPWAEPDLWSQTDMPHASLRYSLAVNVNLERSLSFLICTMGMRTLPLGRLRVLTARKHTGYPWYRAGTLLFSFIVPASQSLWKDPPRGCPVPPRRGRLLSRPFCRCSSYDHLSQLTDLTQDLGRKLSLTLTHKGNVYSRT